ncbi:MAG TPA: ZIP family metal transporter [bacterium]|nr:ZIP family metal transporter [bacterium]
MNKLNNTSNPDTEKTRGNSFSRWTLILLPLVLLGLLIVIILFFGPGQGLRTNFPPVEDLVIQRVELHGEDFAQNTSREMILHVLNNGPSKTTISQVMVDEAYWPFTITPKQSLGHLERARIHMLYPWVEGEAHEITLITSTGATFSKGVDVAVSSPTPSWSYLGIFSLLGVYVGIIPVFLGLLWFPALRNIRTRTMHILLSFTVGLLAFLALDAIAEGLEIALRLPESLEGIAVLVAGFAGSFLFLSAVSRRTRERAETEQEEFADKVRQANTGPQVIIAYTIALGIGLHNLGEGLAIGSAYALGNIALGSMLVIGFALHNTTEGLAIISPVARKQVRVTHLIWMGLLAGVPTILGAWIGGFTYSAFWAVLFLSIGAGAIVQVVHTIFTQMTVDTDRLLTVRNTFGLGAGFAVMYLTGLLVAV